jgi:hypothetical protein
MGKYVAAFALIPIMVAVSAGQQPKADPKKYPPDEATAKLIRDRATQLKQTLIHLQRLGLRDPVLADIEVYHKAADWMTRHEEYLQTPTASQTVSILDRGLLRATQASRGESPWLNLTGYPVVRAYRSRVDGSIQPYAVTFPAEYGQDPKRKWRLDVVLHGRDATLTEVKFLNAHAGNEKSPPSNAPFVQLDIYGRGNNAYRWAGETDVLEAIDSFIATERGMGRDWIDPARFVLRGFSMGGAGTWHLGLHRPGRWCVIGPGAGFSTTRGYLKDLPEQLPAHIESCLHIYDAVEYAPNAFNVPIVAYAGDKDPQLAAAKGIQDRLNQLKLPMTLLIGTGLEHKFPKEWQDKAEQEYLKYAGPGKGRKEYPEQVRFTTWTMKYNVCDWVEILGLDRHYQLSEVQATRLDNGFRVTTRNIRVMRLAIPGGDASPQVITIDHQEIVARPAPAGPTTLAVYLEKAGGTWAATLPQKIVTGALRQPQKIAGLQGPIDDAFTTSFLCVRGTGTPLFPNAQRFADAELDRFRTEWDKFFRAELPVKNDADVTDEDIATKHLILFGDPGSNHFIAQAMSALPIRWNKQKLTVAGVDYDPQSHVPALIYPSPFNTSRYVVLNSGHTFRAADLLATNARLYPRLGDIAVLKPAPTSKDPAAYDIIAAGLFDDFWQLNQK